MRLITGPAPQGWMTCDGTTLSATQYPTLFAMLGNTYGGDGKTTFALPNLKASAALGSGAGYPVGAAGGSGTVSLQTNQMPVHLHYPIASTAPGAQTAAVNGAWAAPDSGEAQYATTASGSMAPDALAVTGQGQGHENMQPYLALTWVIALGTPIA